MRAIVRTLGLRAQVAMVGVAAALGALAFQADASAQTCGQQVQGRIAWNDQGDTAWSLDSITRLCGGRPDLVNNEAPRCFQLAMRRRMTTRDTRWGWREIIDLCEGVQNGRHTVNCMTGRLGLGQTPRQAIDHCTQNGSASRPAESYCVSAVQGNLAWDYTGSVRWSAANLDRLCRGSSSGEPAACFNVVMHRGVNWGGGTQWNWRNAVDLCEGSASWFDTTQCFRDQVRSGVDWRRAIRMCEAL